MLCLGHRVSTQRSRPIKIPSKTSVKKVCFGNVGVHCAERLLPAGSSLQGDSASERVFTVNDVSHGGCKYGIMNFKGCSRGSLAVEMCDNLYFTNRKVGRCFSRHQCLHISTWTLLMAPRCVLGSVATRGRHVPQRSKLTSCWYWIVGKNYIQFYLFHLPFHKPLLYLQMTDYSSSVSPLHSPYFR